MNASQEQAYWCRCFRAQWAEYRRTYHRPRAWRYYRDYCRVLIHEVRYWRAQVARPYPQEYIP